MNVSMNAASWVAGVKLAISSRPPGASMRNSARRQRARQVVVEVVVQPGGIGQIDVRQAHATGAAGRRPSPASSTPDSADSRDRCTPRLSRS